MSRGFDRAACLLACYCFTIGIVAASVIQIAQAQETVPPSPPACARCEHELNQPALGIDPVAAEFFERATRALAAEFGSGGMTFRVTMPRPDLFTESVCAGSACCDEKLTHFFGGGAVAVEHPPATFTAKFLRLGCPCAAAGECTCGSRASCGTECAAAGATACQCCPCTGVAHEAKCGEECRELTDVIVKHVHHQDELTAPSPHQFMQQIAQLMAEKAAAQAALAVRKEADEQIGEIYEAMAELLADNAALDAKLEAQAEHRKLAEKVADLAAENARLKTHVELAAERAEIAHATSALALENERLKLRLAELEQKHAVAEAARTAAKSRGDRKQR